MSDEQSFLDAIIQAPDDDAPRLMYADWLTERGNPRGEFIRVQCQLAQLPVTDPNQKALEDREADLLAGSGVEVTAGARFDATRVLLEENHAVGLLATDATTVATLADSVVRGTTSRKIVKMLRGAGAREVHLRISAPPTTHPCFYGINTPTRSELVAASHTIDEIARYVTCDTLAYLSHDGMMTAVSGGKSGAGYCSACFTGEYPVALGTSDLVQLRRARV